MSGWLVLAIVAAVIFAAFGFQVMARQLQRFPVDSRNPGPLIDTRRHTTWVVRPVELETLNSIVAESMASEAVARSKLWPLVDDLAVTAPRDLKAPGHTRSAIDRVVGRRSRSRQLDDRLTQLEQAWGLDPGR